MEIDFKINDFKRYNNCSVCVDHLLGK